MANEVKIKIYGQEYRIRTDAQPKLIEECANYLNETMTQVAGSDNSSTPQLRLVIFAAMNITAQLFECKKKKDEVINQVESKAIAITEFIEDKISDIESSQN
jgi:cell division protein ZapA